MFDFEKSSTEVEEKANELKAEDAAKQVAESDDAATEAEGAPAVETEDKGQLNRDRETVPLSALIKSREETKAERSKRLALEQQLAESRAEREKADETQHLVDDLGYSEAAAQREVDRRYADRRKMESIEKRLAYGDINGLAKEGSLYAGADRYADEIYDAMRKYDVDAKHAYLMVCDTDAIAASVKEEQTQQEQRNLLKRRDTETKKPETSSPTRVTSSYKLTDTDRAILAELQKAQPDANWTVEKYWKDNYGKTVPKE